MHVFIIRIGYLFSLGRGSDLIQLTLVLPKNLNCAAWFLKFKLIWILHFPNELQMLHSLIIEILLGMRQVILDTLYPLDDVREISELLIRYLLSGKPSLRLQVL